MNGKAFVARDGYVQHAGVADPYEFDPAKAFADVRPADQVRQCPVNQSERRDDKLLGRTERRFVSDFKFAAAVERFAHGLENPRRNARRRKGRGGGRKRDFAKPGGALAGGGTLAGQTAVGRFEVRLERRKKVPGKEAAEVGFDQFQQKRHVGVHDDALEVREGGTGAQAIPEGARPLVALDPEVLGFAKRLHGAL